MGLKRIGKAPLKTCIRGVGVFAKRRDDGLAALLHNEKSTPQPNQDNHAADERCADASALHVRLELWAGWAIRAPPLRAITLAKQAAQFAVEIAPQFVEIWGAFVAAALMHDCVACGGSMHDANHGRFDQAHQSPRCVAQTGGGRCGI